jgi:predicted regulator of Ras-like GTPase activity (Roadblock/LC7/MglB family)
MFRLALRKQWFPFVGSLLLCLVLVISLPSYSPDKVVRLPSFLILIGELLLAFGITGLCYQTVPLPEKLKAAVTFLAVSTAIGAIGNMTSQVNQVLPGGDVLISWIQLGIMNIGGFFATFSLYEVAHASGHDPMKSTITDGVRTVKPREKMAPGSPSVATKTSENNPILGAVPAVPPAPSATPNPASGFTAASLPHPTAMPNMPKPTPPAMAFSAHDFGDAAAEAEPAQAAAPASEAGATAGKGAAQNARITNERIQVQSKRNTSTFTKLQALSATGRQLVPDSFGNTSDGLKSILDRLEDQAEVNHSEGAAPQRPSDNNQFRSPVKPGAGGFASPPSTPQAAPQAPVQARSPSVTGQPAVPQPPAPTPLQPAAQAKQPAVPGKPPGPSKSNIASRLVGVVSRTKMPAVEKFLETPKPLEADTSQVEEAQAAASAQAATDTFATRTVEDIEPVTMPSQDVPDAQPEAGKGKIFESTIDDEMDAVFAKLVPAESQQEVHARHDQAPAETETGTGAETEKGIVQIGDDDLDEVFSKLVSADAQREVTHPEALALPETPATQVPAPSDPNQMFAVGDDDMDEVFAKLVSPEAQKEFQPRAQDPEPAPAPPVAAKSESDHIFQVVDDELDEVFSKLAPAEAQREVKGGFAKEPVLPVEVQAEDPATYAGSFQAQANEPDMSFQVSHQESEAPFPSSESSAESDEGLFGDEVAAELDEIFSSLVPPEAQREVQKATSGQFAERKKIDQPLEQPKQAFEAAPAPGLGEVPKSPQIAAQISSPPSQEGPFAAGLSDEIDDIFSHIAPPEAQRGVGDRTPAASAEPAAPQSSEISFAPPAQPDRSLAAAPSASAEEIPVAKQTEIPEPQEEGQDDELSEEGPVVNPLTKNFEVKEFGRLATQSASSKGQPPAPVGTMKTVGKLLIDVQAIENIIKAGESGKPSPGLATARIISATRGEGIKALLGKIDSFSGVTGCLIVGHDGLVIASTVGTDFDKDALGALSSALLNTSNLATLKLEIGKLRQMVMLTELVRDGETKLVSTILTDVEVGVLAVLLDTQHLDRLDGVLEKIHTTIHG